MYNMKQTTLNKPSYVDWVNKLRHRSAVLIFTVFVVVPFVLCAHGCVSINSHVYVRLESSQTLTDNHPCEEINPIAATAPASVPKDKISALHAGQTQQLVAIVLDYADKLKASILDANKQLEIQAIAIRKCKGQSGK